MSVLSFFLVITVPFLASILSFFTGFGLGTILVPTLAILFPLDAAVFMTGIIHFSNNFFKLFLVGKKADFNIAIRFGGAAVIGSIFGAWIFTFLSHQSPIFNYKIFDKIFSVYYLGIIIGILMIIFATLELFPKIISWFQALKFVSPIGMLSGFFGGISGFQGAFRSAFLINLGLSKESFIATGVIIACAVDFVRLIIYSLGSKSSVIVVQHIGAMVLAILSAWIGSFIGRKILTFAAYKSIRLLLGILLIIFGVLIFLGIID